jgi:hypothetical protein
MNKRASLIIGALIMFLLFFSGRWADEGMWLLDSIHKLPLAEMQRHGLELTSDQIYSSSQASLKDAIVLIDGGTASFISSEGLLITNHHIAFSGIQELSSVEDDYLKNGFLAQAYGEELQTSYTAQIVKEMKEVTDEVLAGISDSLEPETRLSLIRAKSMEIEKKARDTNDVVCRVVEMYSGAKYYLFTYQELRDVRLVYAPPGDIGNYGGEVDNWMWPRHTGDFSLMRAYVGPDGKPARYSASNVPYHPRKFLPISTKGYHEGSFVMVLGFPGRTFRYREASGIAVLRDEFLPETIDLFKARMNVMESWGARDRAIEIKYANRLRGIANTYKNYLGVLEGMRRSDLLAKKLREEEQFRNHIDSSATLKQRYGKVLDELSGKNQQFHSFVRNLLFLNSLSSGVDLFRIAERFHSFAGLPEPKETDIEAVRQFVSSVFKNYDKQVDKDVLKAILLKGSELPLQQQPVFFTELFGNAAGSDRERAIRNFVDDLYDNTDLATPEGCEKMLQKNSERILRDDAIVFGSRIGRELGAVNAKNSSLAPELLRLRSLYIEGFIAWKHESLTYPDANRTLRFTYGQVKPYSPRDAVQYKYYTTLTGVMEKETGSDPFTVPPKLKELWEKKDFGRYVDPGLHDVPVGFIADLDITGGSSGSPVINGNGELIGCAFDGNWEAVVGDYVFQESLNRMISVDSRYVLFILDKFSNAKNLLNEMTIH